METTMTTNKAGSCAMTIALLLGACGETKQIGELDGGSSESGDDSGTQTASESNSSATMTTSSTSETETASGTATTPTTGEEDSSDGESSEADSSGTDTDGCDGGSVCDPQPDGDTEAAFVIDGRPAQLEPIEILERPCSIESVVGDEPAIVTLHCPMGDAIAVHTIETNVPTTLNLVPGTAVVFSHVIELPFWNEEWFSLRLDFEDVDPLLLAGGRASAVHPAVAPQLPEPFYGNVTIAEAQGVCELEPVCDVNACAQERREAIAVAAGGDEMSVYDGRTELVGDGSQFQVRVDIARSYENVQCTDVPGHWYEFVIVNVTEG